MDFDMYDLAYRVLFGLLLLICDFKLYFWFMSNKLLFTSKINIHISITKNTNYSPQNKKRKLKLIVNHHN